MFFVSLIKLKDTQQAKNIALLLSMSLTAVCLYFTGKSILNFITGKDVALIEYAYILLFIYLVANVVFAFKMEVNANDVVTEKKSTPVKQEKAVYKSNLNRNEKGEIVDDFIFNEKTEYNIKKERPGLAPEFSDAGLTPPDEEEEPRLEFAPPVLDFSYSDEEQTQEDETQATEFNYSHEQISFSDSDNEEKNKPEEEFEIFKNMDELNAIEEKQNEEADTHSNDTWDENSRSEAETLNEEDEFEIIRRKKEEFRKKLESRG